MLVSACLEGGGWSCLVKGMEFEGQRRKGDP